MQYVIQLQNRLHEALEAFLSGSILRSSRRIPGRKLDKLHPAWVKRFDDIAAMITDEYRPAAAIMRHGSYRNAALVLSAGYRQLDRRIAGLRLGSREESVIPVTAFKKSGEGGSDEEILDELRNYWTSHCAGQLRGLFVHGSHATGDTNAYSDLDVLVIVNKSVIENAEELYQFGRVSIESNRYLLAADILQHHGHFALTEIDLDYYCDAYFPRVLFNSAKALYTSKPVGVRHVRDCLPEAFSHLKGMCMRFIRPWDRRALRLAYYLKLQLSCFMIIPALLMQALRQPCYKRESFLLAKPMFTQSEWRVMDEVSELRRAWSQTGSPVWKYVASTHPLFWGQIVRNIGHWGVPDRIWGTVRQPDFQERMAVFARKCLKISEETLQGQGVERLD